MELTQKQRMLEVDRATDRVINGGYDAAIITLRRVTQRLVYLIADAKQHRSERIDGFRIGELGLHGGDPDIDFEGIGSVLKAFTPRISDSCAQRPRFPKFKTSLELDEPLTDEEIADNATELGSVLHAINEAIYRLSTVDDPTARQIACLYVEMARYTNIHMIHYSALEEELITPPRSQSSVVDHFGVGKQLAAFVSEVFTKRSLPISDQVSLPKNPSPAAMLDGYFASAAIVSGGSRFRFHDSDYDTSGSHQTMNCTLSVGKPYHNPERLCFDHRLVKDATTNVVILRDYLKTKGASEPAMKYAETITELAQEMADSESTIPIEAMLTLIGSIADTDSLTMCAVRLYLRDKFFPPECLRLWRCNEL